MTIVSMNHSQEYLIYQEGKEGTVFIIRNISQPNENAVSVSCIGTPHVKVGVSYDITAVTSPHGSGVRLRSTTKVVQGLPTDESVDLTKSLIVPRNPSSQTIKLLLLIWKYHEHHELNSIRLRRYCKLIEILNVKRRKLVEAVMGNEDFLCKVDAVMDNDDLRSKILLSFPAELLFRCKCLSKHWCSLISSLISDSKFCSDHTRMNQKSPMLGVYYYFNHLETREGVHSVSLRKADQSLPAVTFLDHVYNMKPVIKHASNGLFLCSFGKGKPYAVFNLTTKTFNQLPLHVCPSSFPEGDMNSKYYSERRCAYLDFDPSKSLHYKIVLVDYVDNPYDFLYYGEDDKEEDLGRECRRPCYEIDIYSSESKTWKRKHFPAKWLFYFEFGPLWNGVIHWITRGDIHVRFELDSENLISNPIGKSPELMRPSIIKYFGECCGRLFLIQIQWEGEKVFNILEMDKCFGWTVAFTVNTTQLRTDLRECFEYPDPVCPIYKIKLKIWKFSMLCVVKEDDNFSLLIAVPGKIISYNLETGTYKVLSDFRAEDFCVPNAHNYPAVFSFIPTLSPTT